MPAARFAPVSYRTTLLLPMGQHVRTSRLRVSKGEKTGSRREAQRRAAPVGDLVVELIDDLGGARPLVRPDDEMDVTAIEAVQRVV